MKITLRLSSKTLGDGKAEVLLSAKRKVGAKVISMCAKSGVYVLPVFFTGDGIDVNKKRVVRPDIRKETLDAKDRLDSILLAIAKAEEDTADFTKDWLKDTVQSYMHPKDEGDHDFFASYLAFCRARKYDRLGTRYSMLRLVKRYETYRSVTDGTAYHLDPMSATTDDIEALQDYAANEYDLLHESNDIYDKVMAARIDGVPYETQYVRPKGGNAIASILNLIRPYFAYLKEQGKRSDTPFAKLEKMKISYGDVIYPTIEERNKIYHTPMPTPVLELTRDAWVLQAVIGCRVGDLLRLTEDYVTNDTLTYTPQKTKDETGSKAEVPLNDIAKEIIAKYRGKDRNGRFMPFPRTERLNENIKKVFRIAGVTRMVETRDPLTGGIVLRSIADVASTHMARWCFVGNAYSLVKDPAIVGKMSGHIEGSESFSRYRKIDKKILADVTRGIEGDNSTAAKEKPDTSEINDIVAKLAAMRPDQLAAIKAILNQSK